MSNVWKALSYTWGCPVYSHAIQLNGQAWKITANLNSALRQLRKENNPPRTLWVDALCMNQKDTAERAQRSHNYARHTTSELTMCWLRR